MPNKISRPEHHLRTADAVPTMTQQFKEDICCIYYITTVLLTQRRIL